MIRVVLCGAGRFGMVYLRRVLEHPDLDLVGVVELADKHEHVRGLGLRPFDTLSEAIDVTCPQLVIVATPPAKHAVLGVYALNRFCHVMMAKPGALGIDQAERLALTADERHRTLTVDYTPTESPEWRRLVDECAGERIDTVRMTRRSPDRFQECGALWDLAPHDVALALSLDPSDGVLSVSARGWWVPASDEAVGAYVVLSHASGRSTRIEVEWTAALPERRVEVVTSTGAHVWDQLQEAPARPDNVTRALDRTIRNMRTGKDDTSRFLRVTRILDDAERSMYADYSWPPSVAA